jgi:hypothetical protein
MNHSMRVDRGLDARRIECLVGLGGDADPDSLVAFRAGGGTVGAGSLLGELKSVIGFSIGLVRPTAGFPVALTLGTSCVPLRA